MQAKKQGKPPTDRAAVQGALPGLGLCPRCGSDEVDRSPVYDVGEEERPFRCRACGYEGNLGRGWRP